MHELKAATKCAALNPAVLTPCWTDVVTPDDGQRRSYKIRQDEHFMNNSDLADAIAADQGIAKTDARKIVDAVFAAISDAAAKGEEVSLNGFGKFKVKDSPEREGRNPATGEAMTIKASKKLTFTVAKAVKDKLNG
jgi:DNA-binding protein HU-beta